MPKPPTRPPVKAVANIFDASNIVPALGRFMMFYGPPGEGKTSLAGQFEKPLFVTTSGEQGIHYLKKAGVVSTDIPVVTLDPPYDESEIVVGSPHPGWQRAIDILDLFIQEDHDRKTLVFDTTSGLDVLCMQTCAAVHFDGDMASRTQDSWNHYANGPRKAATAFWQSQFINRCVQAQAKGYTVILLAHSVTKTVNNLEGPDYEMYMPQLSNQIWSATSKDLTDLVFMGTRPSFVTDKQTKKKKVTGQEKFFGVESSTSYVAKNWHDVRGEFTAGESAAATYKVFSDSMKVGK